jgi:hypothetical protein
MTYTISYGGDGGTTCNVSKYDFACDSNGHPDGQGELPARGREPAVATYVAEVPSLSKHDNSTILIIIR